MSTRSDIIDGAMAEKQGYGLVYTKQCGWIDLGHARPESAAGLWRDIRFESTNLPPETTFGTDAPLKATRRWRLRQTFDFMLPGDTEDQFLLHYGQSMSKKVNIAGTSLKVSQALNRSYLVKRNLDEGQKQSVALAIFMEVSRGFEAMQADIVYSQVTDSGNSVEDLMSDLVGFYRAVLPGKKYVEACEPVSLDEALRVWDTCGGVGQHKNTEFTPKLFEVQAGKATCVIRTGTRPGLLNSIHPASKGLLFDDA